MLALVAAGSLLALSSCDCGIGYGGAFCGPGSGAGMPLAVEMPGDILEDRPLLPSTDGRMPGG